MCAGNTKEEALVQGLAEIIERYVMKKIMIEKPALPDVPDDYIHKYPRIYELLKKTREMKMQELQANSQRPNLQIIGIDAGEQCQANDIAKIIWT